MINNSQNLKLSGKLISTRYQTLLIDSKQIMGYHLEQ